MILDDFNNDNMDVVTLIECIERLMSLSLINKLKIPSPQGIRGER